MNTSDPKLRCGWPLVLAAFCLAPLAAAAASYGVSSPSGKVAVQVTQDAGSGASPGRRLFRIG